MSYTIYKFVLKRREQCLTIKGLVRVLSVDTQYDNDICMWAIVDPDNTDIVPVHYHIGATGRQLPIAVVQEYTFAGTVKFGEGYEMYHIFYRIGEI